MDLNDGCFFFDLFNDETQETTLLVSPTWILSLL